MAGPREIIQACDKLQAQTTSGVNSITQRAAITALLSDLGPTHKMVDAYKERRNYVIGALQNIPGVKANVPHGAFYAFPDISSFFGKTDGVPAFSGDAFPIGVVCCGFGGAAGVGAPRGGACGGQAEHSVAHE